MLKRSVTVANSEKHPIGYVRPIKLVSLRIQHKTIYDYGEKRITLGYEVLSTLRPT